MKFKQAAWTLGLVIAGVILAGALMNAARKVPGFEQAHEGYGG